MKSIRLVFLITGFCIFFADAEAQLLNRVLKESTRKIEREVERMVVDKVTDIIAQKVAQSVESAFDEMVREAMESDSNYVNRSGEPDSTYYSMGQKYGEFLAGMNEAADLPAEYKFDVTVIGESTDYDGTKHPMKMHFSKSQGIIGIEQMDQDEMSMIVVDTDNDITAIYRNEKGKKTVQALPNMMGLVGAMAQSQAEDEMEGFKFTATGKTKMIAGYKCKGYKAETKKQRISTFISEETPIDWKESYGGMIQRISPTAYIDGIEMMDGMVMESSTMEKKKPYKDSMYETKEINEKIFTINNSEYAKTNYGQ